jgi:hypothetical protein
VSDPRQQAGTVRIVDSEPAVGDVELGVAEVGDNLIVEPRGDDLDPDRCERGTHCLERPSTWIAVRRNPHSRAPREPQARDASPGEREPGNWPVAGDTRTEE